MPTILDSPRRAEHTGSQCDPSRAATWRRFKDGNVLTAAQATTLGVYLRQDAEHDYDP